MQFSIFGLNISIDRTVWVTRLIKRATKVGKENGYDMTIHAGSMTGKINRIKAIRLLVNPYPKRLVKNGTYAYYSDGHGSDSAWMSTLFSAKDFVDKYWNE
jgi:hypothetical protein